MDLRGRLTLQRRALDGTLIDEVAASNMIVLDGRELVARLFVGTENAQPIGYVAVGTNLNLTGSLDNRLGNEVFRKKIDKVTISRLEGKQGADADRRVRVQLEVELNFDEPPRQQDVASYALSEAGLFTSASAANDDDVMYNRVLFPVINKTSDFRLTLLWEIIF